MPHHPSSPRPLLPRRLLARRPAVVACAAVAVLAAAAILLAAPATEAPSRALLVGGSLLSRPLEEPHAELVAEGSPLPPAEAPPPSLLDEVRDEPSGKDLRFLPS